MDGETARACSPLFQKKLQTGPSVRTIGCFAPGVWVEFTKVSAKVYKRASRRPDHPVRFWRVTVPEPGTEPRGRS
jgi:hypothetical protein